MPHIFIQTDKSLDDRHHRLPPSKRWLIWHNQSGGQVTIVFEHDKTPLDNGIGTKKRPLVILPHTDSPELEAKKAAQGSYPYDFNAAMLAGELGMKVEATADTGNPEVIID